MTAYMDHKDLTNESIDETRATQIRDGVHRVLDAIAEAESAAGRAPGSVKLLAATVAVARAVARQSAIRR